MNRWLVPATAVVIGAAFVVVGRIGGDPHIAVAGPLVMLAYAAFLLVGSRSETVKVLHGQPSDERYHGYAVNALTFSGLTMPLALLAMGVHDTLTGGDGQPYALLCFLSVSAFLAAPLWQRFRPRRPKTGRYPGGGSRAHLNGVRVLLERKHPLRRPAPKIERRWHRFAGMSAVPRSLC